ncbi:MAG TPA: hypothetical protein PLR56_09280 [Brevefilum sp.]|nr:hypothetical protein [Brevefilum sp.]
MLYTLKSKAGELLKDKIAVEILEKYVPGITKNPLITLAKQMPLEKILAMPQAKQAGITEEMLTKLLDEINARKK